MEDDTGSEQRMKKRSGLLRLGFMLSLFLLICSILTWYLYSFSWRSVHGGDLIFWSLIIGVFVVLFFELATIDLTGWTIALLVFQVVVLNLTLHGIYQLPFQVFYGTDAHWDMDSTRWILNTGHIDYTQGASPTSSWPILHILGATESLISGFGLFSVVKIVPFTIELSLPMIVFILFRRMTPTLENRNLLSLASVVVFVTISNHIEFGSTYIRETMAVPLIAVVTYLAYRFRSESRTFEIAARTIMVIIAIELALTHHFSSFMFIVFCLILTLYERSVKIVPSTFRKTFLSLVVIAAFSYWAFVAYSLLRQLSEFFYGMLTPYAPTYSELARYTPTNIATLRGYLLFYGFFIFLGLFSVVLLAKYRDIKEVYGSVLFLFACGFISMISLFVVLLAIFPDRLLSFGWLFGSLPLVIAVFKLRRRRIRRLAIGLVSAFVLFNIYMIPPAFYSSPQSILVQPSYEDYSVASEVNMTDGRVLAYQNNRMAIIDVYGNNADSLLTENLNGIKNRLDANPDYYDYVVVNNKLTEQIHASKGSEAQYSFYLSMLDSLETGNEYDKVLDSNNIEIFAKGM